MPFENYCDSFYPLIDAFPGRVPDGFEVLLGRKVESDPASESSLAIAEKWLTECVTTHQTCGRMASKERPLPTRIIDVGSNNPEQDPHLVVTGGMHGSWAALSYCWGGDSDFILKSNSLDEMCKGFRLESFPKTLRDAILVTRKLGIQYIWIDALCIMQDSAEDWAVEAARMGNVYGGAIITISAANSPSTSFGMLHDRPIPVDICEVQWKENSSPQCESVFLRSGFHFSDSTMKKNPLNTRGWTLQESLLSPRTLSYGLQQMAWECQERKIDESGRPVAPGDNYRSKRFMQALAVGKSNFLERSMRGLTRLSLDVMPFGWTMVPISWEFKYQSTYSRWFAITKEFSTRNLTVPTDVLPAFSGLARAFERVLKDQYCAGLWKKDLIRSLLWSRESISRKATPAHQRNEKLPNYRVPSWNWASIQGGIISNSDAEEQLDRYLNIVETAKILEVCTTPRFEDPFGQTKDGYLVLRAPLCFIKDLHPKGQDRIGATDSILESFIHGQSSVRSFQSEFDQQHRRHPGQRSVVVRIARSMTEVKSLLRKKDIQCPQVRLMILETTGQHDDEYRRVGLLRVNVTSLSEPDDIEPRLIKEMDDARWEWKEVRII